MPHDELLEARLGRAVHRCLLSGVLASATLMLLGLFLALGQQPVEQEPVTDWPRLFARALAGEGRALVDVGLIVLMFTPVVRVIVLAVGWLAARQWWLAAVSLTVAALLGVSVAIGVG